MKRTSIVAIGIVFLTTAVLFQLAYSQKPDPVDTFMRAKLTHAKDVMEGLTTEDFDMIAKGAQQMSLLSQATQWQVLQTKEYQQRGAEFRRTADKLKKQAQEENLDGALLAYVEVTMKCVECHKYVRSVQNARLDELEFPKVPRTLPGD